MANKNITAKFEKAVLYVNIKDGDLLFLRRSNDLQSRKAKRFL